MRGQSFPADAFDHSAIAEVATLLATAWDPNGQIIRSAASRRNSDSSEPRSYRDNLREMADEVNELDTLRFLARGCFRAGLGAGAELVEHATGGFAWCPGVRVWPNTNRRSRCGSSDAETVRFVAECAHRAITSSIGRARFASTCPGSSSIETTSHRRRNQL